MPPSPTSPPRVLFLFVGGAHQVLHAAPAAAELSRDARCAVTCLFADEGERAMLARVLAAWPDQRCAVEPLRHPRWGAWLGRFLGMPAKLPVLWANRRRFPGCAALVTAERTSTLLRRFVPGLRMIHLPHGAGDRAVGFERRLRRFDLVIVSGQKDAARMIAEGVVAAERCVVAGSVKLGALARLAPARPRLFANDRPVVLYNPHFSAHLGSWARHGRAILDWFAAQTEFNLIVAPHVRLMSAASPAARAALLARAVPDRILVDPGSERSSDMTYTRAADVYLGDVSSQVYEFIAEPRPCIFFDRGATAWENDPNYACWHFGEVVRSVPALATALARARARHPEFATRQAAAGEAALGADVAGAPARAAAAIRDFVLAGG